MIAEDEDALICDFAQYYHVFDYEQLPVNTAAVLACGLPEGSRIKTKMSGNPYSYEQIVLAGIFDTVSAMAYSMTKDPGGAHRPQQLLKKMFPDEKDGTEQTASFQSGTAFEKARARIAGRTAENEL